MDINDLYRELGKSWQEGIRISNEVEILEISRQNQLSEIAKAHHEKQTELLAKQNRSTSRVAELSEAIRLVEEGMDPVQAKLIARESLEDTAKKISSALVTTNGISSHAVPLSYNGSTGSLLRSQLRISASDTTQWHIKDESTNYRKLGDIHGNRSVTPLDPTMAIASRSNSIYP